jgi:hypothetical protein
MPESGLLDACLQLMSELDDVPRIEITDVAGTATIVAKWRPFAVVLAEELYEFDPREFDALARDVGAEIVVVPSGSDYGAVVRGLLPRLNRALHDWEARELGPTHAHGR